MSVNPSTQTQVAQLCLELDRKTREYDQVARVRADAEVDFKAARARRILRARVDEGAKSVAEAEMRAAADPAIEALWRAHLIADGIADAATKAIFALRTRIEFGRSVISSERAADVLHGQGLGGAA